MLAVAHALPLVCLRLRLTGGAASRLASLSKIEPQRLDLRGGAAARLDLGDTQAAVEGRAELGQVVNDRRRHGDVEVGKHGRDILGLRRSGDALLHVVDDADGQMAFAGRLDEPDRRLRRRQRDRTRTGRRSRNGRRDQSVDPRGRIDQDQARVAGSPRPR